MAQDEVALEQLKTFSGLIHRHPLFINDELDVAGYHLSFYDLEGQKLKDDSPVPDFVQSLPNIVLDINHSSSALLSIPESWHHALLDLPKINASLTLDINTQQPPPAYHRAINYANRLHNSMNGHQYKTLLIDLAQENLQQLTDQEIQACRAHYDVLCAINVNNIEQYHYCKAHHLDLLEGDFYTKPDQSTGHELAPSTQTLMSLLVRLQDADVEAEDLTEIINQDITLSYKLLRLINSAFFGLPKKVESTKQAIVMLGLNKIKTWASLLCLSGIDDKPNELRHVAMFRGRMCELLAKYYKGHSDMFFTVGLLSVLDAMLDKPLVDIVDPLPLTAELKTALIDKQGPAGRALADTLSYEQADWETISTSPVPREILVKTYLESIQWAKQLTIQLQD